MRSKEPRGPRDCARVALIRQGLRTGSCPLHDRATKLTGGASRRPVRTPRHHSQDDKHDASRPCARFEKPTRHTVAHHPRLYRTRRSGCRPAQSSSQLNGHLNGFLPLRTRLEPRIRDELAFLVRKLQVIGENERISIAESAVGASARYKHRLRRATKSDAKINHGPTPPNRSSGYRAVRTWGRRDRAKLISVWELTKSLLYLISSKERRVMARLLLAAATARAGTEAKGG